MGLLLPPGVREDALTATLKRQMDAENRALASVWASVFIDDCTENAEPCMDCYQPLQCGEREAVAPALVLRYGQPRDILRAMKFRCRSGCKAKGE